MIRTQQIKPGFGPRHQAVHEMVEHCNQEGMRFRGFNYTLGGFLTSAHVCFQAVTRRSLPAVLIIIFLIISPFFSFQFSCEQQLHRLENIHLTYQHTLRCSLSVLKEIQKYRRHSNAFTSCCSGKWQVYYTSFNVFEKNLCYRCYIL